MRWENYWLPTHASKNISCSTRYSIVQKLSNKQSAKVIWLSDYPCINYIVLRVNPALTSCEDVATALTKMAHLRMTE